MESVLHKYEYYVDIDSATAPAYVTRMVGNNRRVLEMGPGPGSITKMLSSAGCRVIALELDQEAIKKAAPFCETIIQADLNSTQWPQLLHGFDSFDVIVAADVLEHLYDPWVTLRLMTKFLKPQGYLVISLPNAGHAAIMSCLFNGNFEYKEYGLLDRTHIRFFGLKNIEALFTQANLKIIEAEYVVKRPEETELASEWLRLPLPMQEALMSSLHSAIYQVVVKAVPLDRSEDALALEPPQRENVSSPIIGVISFKTRLARHLSPRFKLRIRQGLKVFGIHI
jgi:2-polyprenyl-3-methyl-5-hydroxy-6-metoxy-1,4-benzoquinol methylase